MDAWMDTRKRSLVGANQRSVNGVKKRWVTSTLRDIAEGCWVVSLTSSFSSLSRCLDVFNDHHINERKGSSRETSNMMKFTFQNICTEFGWFINWMIVVRGHEWPSIERTIKFVRSLMHSTKTYCLLSSDRGKYCPCSSPWSLRVGEKFGLRTGKWFFIDDF